MEDLRTHALGYYDSTYKKIMFHCGSQTWATDAQSAKRMTLGEARREKATLRDRNMEKIRNLKIYLVQIIEKA